MHLTTQATDTASWPLLAGVAGTQQTIAMIRQLVDQGVRDPMVNHTALGIIRGVRPYDDDREVRAIYEWVRRNVQFRKDVAGKETLRRARTILEVRAGDCDDINGVLLPSLLGTVGYPTRVVTIAANPAAPDQFTHIYAEANVRGRWIPLDAARKDARFGLAPARYLRKRIWSLTSSEYQDVGGLAGYTGMGFDWGSLISFTEQAGKTATQIITTVRKPKEQLVYPSQPTYAPGEGTVLPSGLFADPKVLWIGAGLLGLMLIMRSRGTAGARAPRVA